MIRGIEIVLFLWVLISVLMFIGIGPYLMWRLRRSNG